MKKTVSINWEEYESIDSKGCWRLVAEFPKGNIRLGFIRQTYNDKYVPTLDLCEGGLVKINTLKDTKSLEEAQNKVYETLFLHSTAESNMIEELVFDWEKEVDSEYRDKTFTLVGRFPGRKIRFAHVRLNVDGEYVMFLDYCGKSSNKCMRCVKELKVAKETVVKRISEG
jgi:hypothetical protein